MVDIFIQYKAVFNISLFGFALQVEYEWNPRPYYNMVQNPTLSSLYEQNALALGLEFPSDVIPSSGSTDMGNVSHVVPSIHPHFGVGQAVKIHTREFTAVAGIYNPQIA